MKDIAYCELTLLYDFQRSCRANQVAAYVQPSKFVMPWSKHLFTQPCLNLTRALHRLEHLQCRLIAVFGFALHRGFDHWG
jgi:hypothetical protein